MKKSAFVLDSCDDRQAVLHGYTTGETWNGFACPLATKEEIERFIQFDSYANQHWRFEGDTLIIGMDDDFPNIEEDTIRFRMWTVKPSIIEDKTLYSLGGWLCWFNAEDLTEDRTLLISILNELGFYTMSLRDERFDLGVEGVTHDNESYHGGVMAWEKSILTFLPEWIKATHRIEFDLEKGFIRVLEK